MVREGGGGHVTKVLGVNAGFGYRDRAGQNVTEGVTDRQTRGHTIDPLYDDNV